MNGDQLTLGMAKVGPDWKLEDEALALLMKDRKDRGLDSPLKLIAEEYCWLSPGQLDLRLDREVYTTVGSPDPNIVSGTFWRVYNPLFGKRPRRATSEV